MYDAYGRVLLCLVVCVVYFYIAQRDVRDCVQVLETSTHRKIKKSCP